MFPKRQGFRICHPKLDPSGVSRHGWWQRKTCVCNTGVKCVYCHWGLNPTSPPVGLVRVKCVMNTPRSCKLQPSLSCLVMTQKDVIGLTRNQSRLRVTPPSLHVCHSYPMARGHEGLVKHAPRHDGPAAMRGAWKQDRLVHLQILPDPYLAGTSILVIWRGPRGEELETAAVKPGVREDRVRHGAGPVG